MSLSVGPKVSPPTPSEPCFIPSGFSCGPTERSPVTEGPSRARARPPQDCRDREYVPRTETVSSVEFRRSSGVPCLCPPVRKSPSYFIRTLFSPLRFVPVPRGVLQSREDCWGRGFGPHSTSGTEGGPRAQRGWLLWGFDVLKRATCFCPPIRKSPFNSVRSLFSSLRFLLRVRWATSSPGRTVGGVDCAPAHNIIGVEGCHHAQKVTSVGFSRSSGGSLPLSVGPKVPLKLRTDPVFAVPFSVSDPRDGIQSRKGCRGHGLSPLLRTEEGAHVQRGWLPWGYVFLKGVPYLCPQVRKSPSNSVRSLVSLLRFLFRTHGVAISPGGAVKGKGWTPIARQGPRVNPTHREGGFSWVSQ